MSSERLPRETPASDRVVETDKILAAVVGEAVGQSVQPLAPSLERRDIERFAEGAQAGAREGVAVMLMGLRASGHLEGEIDERRFGESIARILKASDQSTG